MAKLIVFSGAGLSAESGLSTFRNAPDSLWEKHSIDQICNYLTWRENYDLVHGFYNMRRGQLGSVEPNSAHRQIAEWQTRYNTLILTQNVDNLLERAGCTDVVHLHGVLSEMVCTACGHVWDIGYAEWTDQHHCPHVTDSGAVCNARADVKPNVVFFYEEAPRYREMYAALDDLNDDDVIVVAGTSEQVIPIGSLLLNKPGFKLFNALEPSMSGVYDKTLLMPATAAFPIIDSILKVLMTDRVHK